MTDSLFLDGTASLGRRVVLQEDPDGTTTNSGILIEDEPFAEASRCAFVASKVRRTQD
jgi:co-chaperonin GroES (HSP10)